MRRNSYLLLAMILLEDAVRYFERKIKQLEDVVELVKAEHEMQKMR